MTIVEAAGGIVIVKDPVAFVEVEILVPFTVTVAPSSGFLLSAEVTDPVNCRFCACREKRKRQAINNNRIGRRFFCMLVISQF